MSNFLIVAAFAIAGNIYAQPLIPEERIYFKVSPDVAKLQQDIYHPRFPGKEITHFYRWTFEYALGKLTAERAFSSADLTIWESEKLVEYDRDGKIVKDSFNMPKLPQLNYYTTYEYNAKRNLTKATLIRTTSKKKDRVDIYSKYKNLTSYEMESRFFDDNDKMTVKYTSIFINGLKQKIIHNNGFPPVVYKYDSSGNLISSNTRRYYYKMDKRGNAIATVQIERGFRIYHFFRITYTDGTITGSLEPDKDFIHEWDYRN